MRITPLRAPLKMHFLFDCCVSSVRKSSFTARKLRFCGRYFLALKQKLLFSEVPLSLFGLFMIFACPVMAESYGEQVLHEYKSLYRNVTVIENSRTRCVRLKNKRNPYNSQSCYLKAAPSELLFFYSKAMMSVLATQPDGQKILSVGLGGGTMPTAIHSYFKNMDVTTVEIDPKMLEAARDYMGFTAGERNQVVIQDARFFIKKQVAKGAQYDVVLLDAFNGEYIPEHLTTQEFLQEVKSIMKPGGVLLSNTFSFKDFYHSESVTYDSVFKGFCSMRSSTVRTIVAYKDKACDPNVLKATVMSKLTSLTAYISNPSHMLNVISNDKNWDETARIFTDQFSPANLMNVR